MLIIALVLASHPRRPGRVDRLSMPQDNEATDSRHRALFRPASRTFYREILGVQVTLRSMRECAETEVMCFEDFESELSIAAHHRQYR